LSVLTSIILYPASVTQSSILSVTSSWSQRDLCAAYEVAIRRFDIHIRQAVRLDTKVAATCQDAQLELTNRAQIPPAFLIRIHRRWHQKDPNDIAPDDDLFPKVGLQFRTGERYDAKLIFPE
jgi:hypothetical protein